MKTIPIICCIILFNLNALYADGKNQETHQMKEEKSVDSLLIVAVETALKDATSNDGVTLAKSRIEIEVIDGDQLQVDILPTGRQRGGGMRYIVPLDNPETFKVLYFQ